MRCRHRVQPIMRKATGPDTLYTVWHPPGRKNNDSVLATATSPEPRIYLVRHRRGWPTCRSPFHRHRLRCSRHGYGPGPLVIQLGHWGEHPGRRPFRWLRLAHTRHDRGNSARRDMPEFRRPRGLVACHRLFHPQPRVAAVARRPDPLGPTARTKLGRSALACRCAALRAERCVQPVHPEERSPVTYLRGFGERWGELVMVDGRGPFGADAFTSARSYLASPSPSCGALPAAPRTPFGHAGGRRRRGMWGAGTAGHPARKHAHRLHFDRGPPRRGTTLLLVLLHAPRRAVSLSLSAAEGGGPAGPPKPTEDQLGRRSRRVLVAGPVLRPSLLGALRRAVRTAGKLQTAPTR